MTRDGYQAEAIGRRRPLGRLATLTGALLGLGLAGVAHAGVQASGSLSIFPTDSSLVIGQQINMTVRFTNTSTNTNPPNEDPVAASLTGTTLVKLACTTSACTTELPGTLSFISCTALNAGVVGCALDAGDPTNNTVAITMTGAGVPIGAGAFTNLAFITVEATTPIVSPVNGQFNTRADTEPDDVEACQDSDPVTGPCTTGGGQGSAVLFFPAVCGDGIVNRPEETCDTNPLNQVPGPDQCCPAGNTNCGTPPNPTGGCPAADANDNLCRPLNDPNPCTICGDGVVQNTSGEACDDGNANNTDACTNACQTTTTSTSTSTSSSSSTSTSSSSSSSSSSSTSSSTSTSSSSSTSTSSTTSTTNPAVCRTPGFWGTHAEANPRKPSSQDITGAFLPVTVCGVVLNNTDVGSTTSALEAICVSPQGNQVLQLARQLTAARLNCNVDSCPMAILDLLDDCDLACINDTSDVGDCISDVDAFNNGVSPDALGCHDRVIPGFDPPGAAGSPNDCNTARHNDVFIIQ